jgi:hypothetical protein
MKSATIHQSFAALSRSVKTAKGAQGAIYLAAMAIGLAALIPGVAQAGPPFVTDDHKTISDTGLIGRLP